VSRVAVLEGGRSLERGVSLRSGARVKDALERLGHDVTGIDAGADLVPRLREAAPDVVFIALHGPDGEDGTVQELLDILGLPYTGSGVSACMRAADKVLAKHVLRDAGIPTPDFFAFSETAFRELGAAAALPAIEAQLAFPIVVKPASQGSGLGLSFAHEAGEVPRSLLTAFSHDTRVLLERHVAGRDLAVSVLDGAPLPVVEMIPEGDTYDFAARYDIGRTEYRCPASLTGAEAARAAELAVAACDALGLSGFARVDLMLDTAGGELFVLEADAVPGLTDTSLLPQAAEAAGIPFDDLVGRIVASALAG
jgi:D-alanine-D-alanine ligase